MKTPITILFLLVFATVSAWANTGLSFLEIPVGARESALGGAGVALVTGPSSATYNPALVAFTSRSLLLMNNRHFDDVRASFIGGTIRYKHWALSPHFWGTRVADIEYRIQPTRAPITTFDATNSAYGAALAFQLHPHVALGVTAHYLYQKIFVESSDGWAMDAGIAGKDFIPGLTMGLALNHAGRMSAFVNETPRLPTTLRGGATYERTFGKIGSALITTEISGVRHNTPFWRGGMEFRAPRYLALRAGWVEGLASQNLSVGAGFFWKMIQLDYAFVPYKEGLGEGHRFSLNFEF